MKRIAKTAAVIMIFILAVWVMVVGMHPFGVPAKEVELQYDLFGGQFTVVSDLKDQFGRKYVIVYETESKAMYITNMPTDRQPAHFAPLYNTDGTVRIFHEEEK